MGRKFLQDNEAMAFARSLRVSPFKLNLLAASIRGLSCVEALNQLTFSRKRIAVEVKKVVQSAIANAENNHNLDIDSLVISSIQVGKGIVMKRFRARAKGRGAPILKPFSNLLVVVREQKESK
ncbi:50S ribosomal protein L22 [Rickettsiales bacterium LUAb2]